MRSFYRCVAIAGLLALAAGGLEAQGTITDFDAVFARTSTPFDDSPSANLTGVSTPGTADHLFETGWWFRVAGDNREFFFPVPTESYVGNTSTLTWDDVGGRGLFSAQEVAQVYDGGAHGVPDKGNVYAVLTITNLSFVTPLTLDLFHMVDFDLQPTASDDSAALVERSAPGFFWTVIEVRDAGANFAHYQGTAATAYVVRPFGAGDVGALLSDADIDDFDDSGLPFGPGDFTAGYQWSRTVPAGGHISVSVQMAVNWNVKCRSSDVGLLCDGFEVGDTSIWSATAP